MHHTASGSMIEKDHVAPLISSRPKKQVKNAVDSYEKYHTSFGGDLEKRKQDYTDMVNKYYDLATSFYEYGWGTSFHFAHRFKGESHSNSIKRHEHYLALRLGLGKGMKVLDVGCGIGGPLREIAMFSGASVTGLNNNSYQISRGEYYNRLVGCGLTDRCGFVKADFMKIPFPDNHFDAIYEIDATCHAPDAVACYREILRVLKPGQLFAGYEWCSTDLYDPSDARQRRIMAEIELGNGLPDVRSTDQVSRALVQAGFEMIETTDLSLSAGTPWWEPLDPDRWTFNDMATFRTTRVGRLLTRQLVWWMETLRVAPEGTKRVSAVLERAADSLVSGGKEGIFTPLYFFVVRKPLTGAAKK